MDFVVFLTFISSIQRDKSPIPLFLSVIQFVRGKNQKRKNFRERKFAFIRFFFGKLEEICIICKRIFARSDYSGVKFSYVLIVSFSTLIFARVFLFACHRYAKLRNFIIRKNSLCFGEICCPIRALEDGRRNCILKSFCGM